MTFSTQNLPNEIHAIAMALAMFTVSVFLAKFVYIALKKSACRLIATRQDLLTEGDLERIALLICLLIPVVGFSTAQNLLTFPQKITVWLATLIQGASQIILVLILLNVLDTTLQAWLSKQMDTLWEFNASLARKHEDSLESGRKFITILLKIFLFFLPASTGLIMFDLAPETLWAGTAVFLTSIILASINLVSRTKTIVTKAVGRKRYNTAIISSSSQQHSDPNAKEREAIAELFLELFKFQLGSPGAKIGKISSLDNGKGENSYIYELQAQINGDWKSRRMTIGPLGSETGSRSKCYFVIYDEYVVIKIPPKKITRVEDYLRMLRKEKSIVDQINMKECIIPTISAQLKNIRGYLLNSGISPLEDEDDYIRAFTLSAQLRKYLQIDRQFAFFMDLSQYFFLQHVVLSMHSIDDIVPDVIAKHYEIAWDIAEFENRYGIEIVSLIMTIKKAYGQFETECKELLREQQVHPLPSSFQLRRWFFNQLAEKDIVRGGAISDNLARDITLLLKKTMSKHLAPISKYRETVRMSVFKTEFYRNKAAMEGICTNLLKLLAHLKKTGVSMRDLKPDNLLVAGDRDEYPGFLVTPDRYKIGLIDVETAVIFGNRKPGKIAQPQMGGTPQYATPSHFFKNEVLDEMLGNLPLTLHYQDWHATIAIIYKIVTGGILFEQTVHAIPLVIDAIRKALLHQTPLAAIFKQMSGLFWERAVREFNEKLRHREDLLRAAIVDISPSGSRLLREHIRNDFKILQKDVQSLINSQTIWTDPAKQTLLAKCSPEKIKKFKDKSQQTPNQGGSTNQQQRQMVIFFTKLESLKLALRNNKQIYILLDDPEAKLSVFELLKIMFHLVHRHMYRNEWQAPRQDKQRFDLAVGGAKSGVSKTVSDKSERTKTYLEMGQEG